MPWEVPPAFSPARPRVSSTLVLWLGREQALGRPAGYTKSLPGRAPPDPPCQALEERTPPGAGRDSGGRTWAATSLERRQAGRDGAGRAVEAALRGHPRRGRGAAGASASGGRGPGPGRHGGLRLARQGARRSRCQGRLDPGGAVVQPGGGGHLRRGGQRPAAGAEAVPIPVLAAAARTFSLSSAAFHSVLRGGGPDADLSRPGRLYGRTGEVIMATFVPRCGGSEWRWFQAGRR